MTNKIALITGGNKGLGYETARRLKLLDYTVYIGARDVSKGREAAQALGVEWLSLDVTDEASVQAAAKLFASRETQLDVLINNAGVGGTHKDVRELNAADAAFVFDTNLIGPIRVTQAFIPLLEKSALPIIVNVSSGLGSFAAVHDSSRIESTVKMPLYCASKSALTMLTVQYARCLPHFRINAADPGYTATDINQNQGPQTVEEGTDAIVYLATLAEDGPTGTFVDRHGTVQW